MGPIAAALREHFSSTRPVGVVAAYVFGSHARGTPHRESDVDVAVLFDFAALPKSDERGRRG